MLNIMDTILIQNDIQSARKQGAEIVLVFFHYGSEYQTEPTEAEKFIVGKTKEFGADLIIGSHPHVLQPMELYKTSGAKLDTGVIAWSLGNFISNQKDRYCDVGVILNISLEKNFTKNKIKMTDVSYIPTWVYRGTNEEKKIHIIFPSEYYMKDSISNGKDSLPSFLNAESKAKMKQAFQDAKKILNRRSAQVKMKSVLKK